MSEAKLLARWSRPLAVIALQLCVLLSPVLGALLAPRAIGLIFPITAFLCLPYFVVLWRQGQRFSHTALRWIAFVAVFLLIGLLRSPVPAHVPEVALLILTQIGGALIVMQVVRHLLRPELKRILVTLAVGTLTTLLLLLVEWCFDMPVTTAIRTLQGQAVPPIYALDRVIILAILLLWPLLGYARLLTRWVWLLGAFALVAIEYLVMRSTSQAATAGLALGLAVLPLALLFPVFTIRAVRLALLVGMISAPLLLPLLNEALNYNFWPRSNANRRMLIWLEAGIEILNRPWVGHGIEASRTFGLWGPVQSHPHNGVLQIWAEFGLIGILVAGYAMRALLIRIEAMATTLRPIALSAFMAWVAVFLVGYSIWQPWWMAASATLLVLFVGLERLARAP